MRSPTPGDYAVCEENSIRDSSNRFLTLDEVCSRYQLRPSWVYQRSRKGKIPVYKFGQLLRFSSDEIEAWARGER